MATRGDGEGFVSTALEENGARHKDSYYPMSDENSSEFKDTDAEFKRLKGSLVTDVGEIFQGANHLGVHRHFNVGHNKDQQIFPSLKSLHSSQPTWNCGSIKSKHSSICIKLRTMTSDIN